MTTSTHVIQGTPVTVTETGSGHPVLLLHGGGGPGTVQPWAERLAHAEHARVLVPVHPGFNDTPKPDGIAAVRDLAALYVELIKELDLDDVTVVGNSLGGWIAAEIGALAPTTVSSIVLVDAVGLAVDGHPYADFFALTPAEVAQRSYADPQRFGVDPATLPPTVRAIMMGNRIPLKQYGGDTMADPTLADRLPDTTAPVLVIWGEADRIGDPDVGEAFARLIPSAEFTLLPDAGHLPQIETPDVLVDLVWRFADEHARVKPRPTIGVVGSGRVAQTLARAWREHGHTVLVGSRSPGNETVALDTAVAEADVVVNATPGTASLEALTTVSTSAWHGQVLLDVANAVTPAFDLLYTDGSLAQRIAAAVPDARVVKSLNTASMNVLVEPLELEPASVFLSGDDEDAKDVVRDLLHELGWSDDGILDLGGLATARAAEHWFLMFATLMRERTEPFNLRIVGPRS